MAAGSEMCENSHCRCRACGETQPEGLLLPCSPLASEQTTDELQTFQPWNDRRWSGCNRADSHRRPVTSNWSPSCWPSWLLWQCSGSLRSQMEVTLLDVQNYHDISFSPIFFFIVLKAVIRSACVVWVSDGQTADWASLHTDHTLSHWCGRSAAVGSHWWALCAVTTHL